MPEQFHHLPGALLPGDNRQCVECPMGFATIRSTEKAMTLTICDCILRFGFKMVLLYVNFTIVYINIELRHKVSTSQRCNTEQERVRNLKMGQSTFCRPGGVPIKNCQIAIFLHFHVYIYLYIYKKTSQIFCVVFFAKILPNHTTVSELPKRSVSKACQVLSTNVTQFQQNGCL